MPGKKRGTSVIYTDWEIPSGEMSDPDTEVQSFSRRDSDNTMSGSDNPEMTTTGANKATPHQKKTKADPNTGGNKAAGGSTSKTMAGETKSTGNNPTGSSEGMTSSQGSSQTQLQRGDWQTMALFGIVIVVVAVVCGLWYQQQQYRSDIDRIDKELRNISTRLDTIEERLNGIKPPEVPGFDGSKFVRVEKYTSARESDLQKMETVEEDVAGHKAQIGDHQQRIEEIERERVTEKQTINDRLAEIEGNLKKYENLPADVDTLKYGAEVLTGKINTAEESQARLRASLDNAEEEAEKLRNKQVKFTETLKVIKDKHDETFAETQNLGSQYVDLSKEVNGTKDAVFSVLMPNAFNKESVLKGFVILSILAAVLVVYFMKRPANPVANQQHLDPADNYPEGDSHVIDRIPANQPPQDAICVVSFNDITKSRDETLVNQALRGVNGPRVEYRVVKSHDDIVCLPSVKLYLMFVDYSERPVIIEEENLGLGDYKRLSVQAFKKHGGDFFIIYADDRGSRSLPPGTKYNPDLTVVQRQAVLTDLNRRGRFFSVDKRFSDTQLQRLQNVIMDTFQN